MVSWLQSNVHIFYLHAGRQCHAHKYPTNSHQIEDRAYQVKTPSRPRCLVQRLPSHQHPHGGPRLHLFALWVKLPLQVVKSGGDAGQLLAQLLGQAVSVTLQLVLKLCMDAVKLVMLESGLKVVMLVGYGGEFWELWWLFRVIVKWG